MFMEDPERFSRAVVKSWAKMASWVIFMAELSTSPYHASSHCCLFQSLSECMNLFLVSDRLTCPQG